jgi:transposase
MAFYMRMSYRDMEEWLLATDAVCRTLELPRVPDHSTLSRIYKKLRVRDFDKMKSLLLSELGIEGSEEAIAADSTGFTMSTASAYYQSRRGRTCREWVRGAYCVGTHSQLILAWRTARGPGNDIPYLSGLRRKSRRYGRYSGGRRAWVMIADCGFDGKTVQEGDLIPPVRRHGNIVDPARKARADLVSQARLDGVYGQRWKTETAHSVIKRKFGDAIRSRRRALQNREPIIKALIYNIHV